MRIEIAGATRRVPGLTTRLRAVARRLGPLVGAGDAVVTVLLTDDAGIAELNARFASRHEPTDVLAFPSGEGGPGDVASLGDIAISLDRARAQAADFGHGVAEECEVLLLHAVLHLLGHDHETDDGQMRALEADLARTLFGGTRGLIGRSAVRGRSRTAAASRRRTRSRG